MCLGNSSPIYDLTDFSDAPIKTPKQFKTSTEINELFLGPRHFSGKSFMQIRSLLFK